MGVLALLQRRVGGGRGGEKQGGPQHLPGSDGLNFLHFHPLLVGTHVRKARGHRDMTEDASKDICNTEGDLVYLRIVRLVLASVHF